MAIERFGGDIGVRMRFPLVALDAVPGGSAVWKGAPLEIWATGRADDVALSFHVSDSTTSRGGTSEHTCPSIHTLPASPPWSSARVLRPPCTARRADSGLLRPLDVSLEQAGRRAPSAHPPAGWGWQRLDWSRQPFVKPDTLSLPGCLTRP